MNAKATTNDTPEQWAIVELMGHVKLAGKLSEEERFGSKMGRLDIPIDVVCTCPPLPSGDRTGCRGICGTGFVTQHFGGQSVYRITYCTEAVARATAARNNPAPVSPWDYPKQLPSAPVLAPGAGDDSYSPEDNADDDERHREF